MSENGIIKSTAELKAEIKKFKMNNKSSKLLDNITDNLRSHVKNMQLHMVYLHNNAIVQGKPRYEIKLNNLNPNPHGGGPKRPPPCEYCISPKNVADSS